jgi:hypothetical protein
MFDCSLSGFRYGYGDDDPVIAIELRRWPHAAKGRNRGARRRAGSDGRPISVDEDFGLFSSSTGERRSVADRSAHDARVLVLIPILFGSAGAL